jgi:hypothetical protein
MELSAQEGLDTSLPPQSVLPPLHALLAAAPLALAHSAQRPCPLNAFLTGFAVAVGCTAVGAPRLPGWVIILEITIWYTQPLRQRHPLRVSN